MQSSVNEEAGGCSNHLVGETSPYLKQHVSNPVDWYPWGETAIARARRENKPIFLSIGYSACHWCHVMERESFTDTEVAALLNENFISIKVDREERPDVDEIYMTAVQILTGSGGWPLNVLLTPSLEPFFGGTYFPPEDGYGRPGFKRLLQYIARIWSENPGQVVSSATELSRAIRNTVVRVNGDKSPVGESLLANAVKALERSFDPQWGGFGPAPKFPPSGSIAVLLRQYRHTGSPKLLSMATQTLDRMAQGGMFDQVGGGFHRYSVDERWLVPHFEKMLYDNALLARVYLEAAQVTGYERYRTVARATLDFVLRDMADPAGGFHCALDADSDGAEGLFYTWSPQEIIAVLGPEDGALCCGYFGVTESSNFEGRSILHCSDQSLESVRSSYSASEELEDQLPRWRRQLRDVREEREWPGKDDKVLASWNGLMISALARGYTVLGDERYLEAAERTADFVLTDMTISGELQHQYRRAPSNGDAGGARVPAFLDDYAEVANALIDLYEASFDGSRLTAAIQLVERMIADFHDPDGGGFFFTSSAHDHLLIRTKPFQDGAVPAGNSTAALTMLRLARFLDNDDLREKAAEIFCIAQESMSQHPQAFTHLLCAVDFFLDTPSEVVLVGRQRSADTEQLLGVVRERFAPNEIVALVEPDNNTRADTALGLPLLEGKEMIDDAASAYVCTGYSCSMPVTDADELRRLLTREGNGLN